MIDEVGMANQCYAINDAFNKTFTYKKIRCHSNFSSYLERICASEADKSSKHR